MWMWLPTEVATPIDTLEGSLRSAATRSPPVLSGDSVRTTARIASSNITAIGVTSRQPIGTTFSRRLLISECV